MAFRERTRFVRPEWAACLALGVIAGAGLISGPAAAEESFVGYPATSFVFPALQNGSRGQIAQAAPAQSPNVAQREIRRGETVRGRARPDYDAQGLPVGSFRLFPEMVVAPLFDDNVFRAEDDTEADIVTVLSPTVGLQSDWSRHRLNFEAGADVGLYVDHTDENFEDYHFDTSGQLDVTRDTQLGVSGGFAHGHQGRGDPDDPAGALEPTEFDRFRGNVRGSHRMGRFTGILSGTFLRQDYEDVPRRGGGLDINNDDRDSNTYSGSAQVNYEIIPDYAAFVRGGVNSRDYDDDVDDNGIDRNSHGYEIVAGADIDFNGIVFGEVFAGYAETKREDATLDDFGGISVGADIIWNVTRLTTVTGTVAREIRDTTLAGASGSFATTVGLAVDHELLRNLIVSLNASGIQNDYEGIDRTDYNLAAGIAVDYFINRYFFVGALYEHRERLSGGDQQGRDFAINVAGVRAGAQF